MNNGAEAIQAKAGKYLAFRLGEEHYGVDIMQVDSIIGLMSITRVPKTPDFIRGVINLRGKVLPVVDLRKKFDMNEQQDTRRTCIIVLNVLSDDQQMLVGIIVDDVSEVLNIDEETLQPPPSFGANVQTQYITGVGRFEDRMVMLLDVNSLFSSQELTTVADAV